MSKQSNKQTQHVKVTVNNKIESKCCDEKKKKRRRRQQQQPPIEEPINEFPVMDTPARRNTTIPNVSLPVPLRNTVYAPNSISITPEGNAGPVPSYFESYYTNLTRTMEDMRMNILSEIEDVKQLTALTRPDMMTNATQTTRPELSDQTFAVNIPPQTRPQTSPAIASTSSGTPVKDLIPLFETQLPYDLRERAEPEPAINIPEDWLTRAVDYQMMTDEEILNRYRRYVRNTSTEGRTRKSLIDALIRNAKIRSANLPPK